MPQTDNLDKYVDFINFSNSRIKHPLSKLFKKVKKQSNLPDNLIGMTNDSIVNNAAIVSLLSEELSQSCPCSYNYGSINNMNRLVLFQILALDELSIIHEINHAITRDVMAVITEDNKIIDDVQKTGLNIDVSNQYGEERIVEELLNEKASEEIKRIFKLKGGDLSTFCLNIPLEYPYEYNFYLIDDFYTKFKKYIKISRISDNKNELVSRVGKNEYEEFVKLVNTWFTEDISQTESRKKITLPIIKKLVDKMSENVDNSHTPSSNEINEYLEQLEKSGYNLRMINSLYNESDEPKYESDKEARRK